MLHNNSNEMKTVVETFIIEETAELIYDNDKLDQWNSHVESLGLAGQKQIQKPEKSPIPFMHLKTSMVSVFETLCPRKVAIEVYNITPIPVEILDLVALSKREGYFSEIEIWYDEKSPDPVCVGVSCTYYTYSRSYTTLKSGLTLAQAKEEKEKYPDEVNGYSTTNRVYYLLGKWADVKHSFEELMQMAANRFMREEKARLSKIMKETQRALDDLEVAAFERFSSDGSPSLDFPF